MKYKITGLILLCSLILMSLAPAMSVLGYSSRAAYDQPQYVPKRDNRPDPLTTRQLEHRQRALQAQLNGKGKAYGKTGEVARGQYVELSREGEDPIWTVLGEFHDFSHNSIAEPDREYNNTTIWTEDFDRDYYMDLLFDDSPGANSMRNYYIEQSSNRYAVYGDVTDWVAVPGDAASYDDDLGGPAVWEFLIDSIDGWYANQIDAGLTPAEIDDYLSQFDVWDRYDWDGDGNFDEPDGYIDHFQSVHSGEGEEAGGGVHGNDAIWSHSWYAYYNLIGVVGPSPDYLLGGIQIGESSYWVGKYTIQPENGGVGVFAHEYAHDLGLPDLYSNTAYENSTGFWTLMSYGASLGSNIDICSKPCHMGVWEKFQLGWLNYEVAFAGQKSIHRLGPAETNTKHAQGLFVVLPDKEVITDISEPYSGNYFYYSGSGNNLDNLMYKSFNLGSGTALTAKVNYSIETDWDYAYLIVSTDGGTTWVSVETNLSTTTDPYGQNFGYGITGYSSGWVDLTADLSTYTGDILLGFRYWTDVAFVEPGFMIDDIEITGHPLDDAESDTGWTLNPLSGFRRTTGQESAYYFNAYVAEFRQYRGYDASLADGYNFGWPTDLILHSWVEHFPYQDGLLISYWDTSRENNDKLDFWDSGGLLLPIDAHPDVMYRADEGIWLNLIQTYDATFGLEPTDDITLHWYGEVSTHASQPAVPVFNDNIDYWNVNNPTSSVQHPHTGTTIRVASIAASGAFMQVMVNMPGRR